MHTPGPWYRASDADGTMITNNDGAQIALWPPHGGTIGQCANARLIAAAPALLTALAELVGALEADAMDDKSNVYRSMMLSANHAIALATED